MWSRRRKRVAFGSIAVVLVIIVIVHVYLAVWLTRYVNRVLDDMNGYHGSIQTLSLDLYRGAYKVYDLEIFKKQGKFTVPFIKAESIDFSLQWSALIHGRIVSDIHIVNANVNFAVDKTGTQKQTGAEIDWTKKIKDLLPIDINEITVQGSKVAYRDLSSTPQVNIYMTDMSGEIHNLRNVTDKDKPLPSAFQLKGNSIGHGTFKLAGRANILKQMPDVDMAAELVNVDLPALNSYSDAYAAIDFEKGKFSVYSEMKVINGKLNGYVKPIATDISIISLKKTNPFKLAWESFVSFFVQVFSNQSHDQFATRIDITGDLNHPQTDTWSTITGIFHNAFIKAFEKKIDRSDNPDVDAKKD